MPKKVNNATASSDLVAQFDLKGRVDLLLDETVVPVVVLGDLSRSAGRRRCGRNFGIGASGAGLFGYSGVAAVEGVNLTVHSVIINCNAAQANYRINLFTPADFTTIGVLFNNLFAFDSPDPNVVASQVWNGVDVSSVLGDPLVRVGLLNLTTQTIPMDFTLFGDNLDVVAGLGVIRESANTELAVSYICSEVSV